jgi:UDP-2-acetamido-3-amino-2,3-dideoxy-glucuronate N-acetyltransferase
VRVLLVGVGRWGEKHLRVLRALGAEVWVAERSAERRAWAERQGLPPTRIVSDVRAALDAVEAVDVVTPADSHAAVAGAALAAGRHCFVEKPLALTAAEGRRLAAWAREAGRVLQVGHIFRFHPATAVLRDALAAGRIGRVRFATARFAGFKRPRPDVGVTHTDAIHFFDLFAYLLGQAPTRVMAVQRAFLGRDLDDMSVTVIHYGGVPAVVQADYFTPGTWRECVIVGEEGSLVADYTASTVTLYQAVHRRRDGDWQAVDAGKEHLPTASGEPLRSELAAFLDACAGRPGLAVSAAEAVSALEVVEAASLAARLDRAVSLDEVRR